MSHTDADRGQELDRAAYLDPALNIPDRKGFLRDLDRLFADPAPRNRSKGYLVKLYLEDFKTFNESFGYHFGDKLLQEIVRFLESVAPGCVYRYGGVEFILVLEKLPFHRVNPMVKSILERFVSAWHIEDLDCLCSVDAGVVSYPDMASDRDSALKMLDLAVQEAAQRGQNRMAVFDEDMLEQVHRRQAIAQQLRAAVKDGSIELRYRPLYSAEAGRYTLAETYPRLHSPEFGVIHTAEFMRIVEDSGLVCSVGLHLIREVCARIRRLMDDGVEFEAIALPLSPVQCIQESLVDDVAAILEELEIPAGKLAFEITESALLNSASMVIINMQELSALGVKLILNDFGSGYSGMDNILSLPVDMIRFERSFIWQLETEPRSGLLIEGLIRIAHSLGLRTIAEGVETESQNKLLREYQCSFLQGLYYAPTVSPEELGGLLGTVPEEK